jgi:hypothetical protein
VRIAPIIKEDTRMTCVPKPYPCDVPEYALTGPQVEPEASFWNHCPQLRVISIRS